MLKEYGDIIKRQEDENIIERVSASNEAIIPGGVHYLPHAIVREDRETSKLRVVYDASSNSLSLNDCLEKGSCSIPLIFDILVRFRAYKVALISDIKQAYLNVEVNEEDRDFLRFLWLDDVNSKKPNVVTYRFTRVIFGMNSSQFLLASVIVKHLEKYKDDTKFVDNFLRNLYVDDIISGGESVQEALELYVKSKYRLLEAGLTLRKWHSSDSALEKRISTFENENNATQNVSTPSSKEQKVLGVTLVNTEDIFHLNLSIDQCRVEEFVNTKRNVLKIIASIYDPLGLLPPITVMFKMFSQLLCIHKLDWDKPLCHELNLQWKN